MNIELIGFVAGSLGLSLAVPQLFRLLQLRTSAGVSISTWIAAYLSFSSWFTYGVRTDSPSISIANGIAILLTAIYLFYLLAYSGSQIPGTLRLLLLIIAPLIIFGILWNVPDAAIQAVLLTTAMVRAPQAWTSFKNRNNESTQGVSVITWIMGFGSSFLWITYAALSGGRTIMFLTTSLEMFFSAVILWTELRKHRHAGN